MGFSVKCNTFYWSFQKLRKLKKRIISPRRIGKKKKIHFEQVNPIHSDVNSLSSCCLLKIYLYIFIISAGMGVRLRNSLYNDRFWVQSHCTKPLTSVFYKRAEPTNVLWVNLVDGYWVASIICVSVSVSLSVSSAPRHNNQCWLAHVTVT